MAAPKILPNNRNFRGKPPFIKWGFAIVIGFSGSAIFFLMIFRNFSYYGALKWGFAILTPL